MRRWDLLFEREAQAAGAPADNGDKETARAGKQLRTSRSKRTAADGKEKEAAVEDDSGKGQTDGPAKKEKSLEEASASLARSERAMRYKVDILGEKGKELTEELMQEADDYYARMEEAANGDEEAEPVEEAAPAEEAETEVTADTLRDAVRAYIDANSPTQGKELIAQYGATRLSEVSDEDKPKLYKAALEGAK